MLFLYPKIRRKPHESKSNLHHRNSSTHIISLFIGKFTAPTVIKTETPTASQTNNSDMLNMNTVTDFEATKTGLMLYTSNGDGYYWEK